MSWSRAPEPDNLTAMVNWPPLMVLAAMCLGEAEGESDKGKLAVCWVACNRAADTLDRWPNDIGEVCLQRSQFSCFNDPHRRSVMLTPKIHTTAKVWEACFASACAAMFKLAPDPSRNANHYLCEAVVLSTSGKLPSWFHEAAVTTRIGNHCFLSV